MRDDIPGGHPKVIQSRRGRHRRERHGGRCRGGVLSVCVAGVETRVVHCIGGHVRW